MLPVHPEEHDRQRQRDHQRNVPRQDVVRKRRFAVRSRHERRNDGRKPDDGKRVEEIRADDVSEDELMLTIPMMNGEMPSAFATAAAPSTNTSLDHARTASPPSMRTSESQNGMSEYIVKKAATARRSATAL